MAFSGDEFLNADATLWGQPQLQQAFQADHLPRGLYAANYSYNGSSASAASLTPSLVSSSAGQRDSGEPPAKRTHRDAGNDSASGSSASAARMGPYLVVSSSKGEKFVIGSSPSTSHGGKKGRTRFEAVRGIKDDKEMGHVKVALKTVCQLPSFLPLDKPDGAPVGNILVRMAPDPIVQDAYHAILSGDTHYSGLRDSTSTSKAKEDTQKDQEDTQRDDQEEIRKEKKRKRDRENVKHKHSQDELAILLLTAQNDYYQRRVAEQAKEMHRLGCQIKDTTAMERKVAEQAAEIRRLRSAMEDPQAEFALQPSLLPSIGPLADMNALERLSPVPLVPQAMDMDALQPDDLMALALDLSSLKRA